MRYASAVASAIVRPLPVATLTQLVAPMVTNWPPICSTSAKCSAARSVAKPGPEVPRFCVRCLAHGKARIAKTACKFERPHALVIDDQVDVCIARNSHFQPAGRAGRKRGVKRFSGTAVADNSTHNRGHLAQITLTSCPRSARLLYTVARSLQSPMPRYFMDYRANCWTCKTQVRVKPYGLPGVDSGRYASKLNSAVRSAPGLTSGRTAANARQRLKMRWQVVPQVARCVQSRVWSWLPQFSHLAQ